MSAPVPEWAKERAETLASECGHAKGIMCSAVDAFAAYIAAHEEPPVDPLEQAVEAARDAWLNDRDGLTLADCIRAELAKQGLAIELAKTGGDQS